MTPLEIAEALVQSLPETIQQSGGEPITIDMIDIDFDPNCEAATDEPTSFWIRTDTGLTFTLLVMQGQACRELHCRGAEKHHLYGDEICDWEILNGEVSPKD